MASRLRCTVMTGATGGIGRTAALEMLRRDPDLHLILLGRASSERLRLTGREQAERVSVVSTDLASLASIRSAVSRVGELIRERAVPPVTGVVGNAGLQLTTASQVSADGIEMTFAVNVVANFVLVTELAQQLTPPARVVITTSDTHFGDLVHNLGMVPAPRWLAPDRLARPDGWPELSAPTAGRTAYSTSKLAVIYLVHALAERLPAGVEVFSFNPGLVPGTGLARDGGRLERFAFARLLPLLTRTPLARTATRSGGDLAAIALGRAHAPSGAYFNGQRVQPSSPESYDPARTAALWDSLRRLVNTGSSLP